MATGSLLKRVTQEGHRTPGDGGYDSAFVDYDLDGDLDLFASTDAGVPQR